MKNDSGTERLYKGLVHNVETMLGSKETTFSSDLLRIGKSLLKSKFAGIFPADKIPILTEKVPYAIVNLDDSNESGSHWVAIARDKESGKPSGAKPKIIFYDSFGRPDKFILPSLGGSGQRGEIVNTDLDREQKIKETNCGQRSLGWILFFDKYGAKEALKI